MWNQDNFDATFYENDPFERFTSRGGHASCSSAGLGVVTATGARIGRKVLGRSGFEAIAH
jgi:hypothetical protein